MIINRLLFLPFFLLIYGMGFSKTSSTKHSAITTKSYYVPAVEGTKLAVDVHFPSNYEGQKFPVLFEFTRYWRSREDPTTGEPISSLGERDKYFLENGYILVKVDVRGTGASYGTRPGEYTPIEVMDAKFIVDWVIINPGQTVVQALMEHPIREQPQNFCVPHSMKP